MTQSTNIPAFATTMAAIPKRLRAGLHAAQHGRENTMLVESEQDPSKFVGRITKTGRRRYSFEAFEGSHSKDDTATAKVIATGRTGTPLRAIGLARQHHTAHQAD